MEDMLFQRLASSFFFTFSFRFLLGPARDWSRDRAPAQTRPAKEGREGREGKEGRKGRKERACGAERSGPVALMMDGSMDTDESKTSSGGREG
jgi:hypothetical protein